MATYSFNQSTPVTTGNPMIVPLSGAVPDPQTISSTMSIRGTMSGTTAGVKADIYVDVGSSSFLVATFNSLTLSGFSIYSSIINAGLANALLTAIDGTVYIRVVRASGNSNTPANFGLNVTYTPKVYSAVTSPTTVSPAVTSTSSVGSVTTLVTLSWSGASAGSNNAISGYEIECSDSATLPGTSWEYGTGVGVVTTSATSGSFTSAISQSRGFYRRWRIRATGVLGTGYDGQWVYFGAYRTNAEIYPPSVVELSPETFAAGDLLTLSWSGASAGDTSSLVSFTIIQYWDGIAQAPVVIPETSGSGSISAAAPDDVGVIYCAVYYTDSLGDTSSIVNSNPIATRGTPLPGNPAPEWRGKGYSIFTAPIRYGEDGCYRFSVLHTIDNFDAFVDLHDVSTDAGSTYFSITIPTPVWRMYVDSSGEYAIRVGSLVRVTRGEHNEPDTEECGGVVDRLTFDESDNSTMVEGRTWRGLSHGKPLPYTDNQFPVTLSTSAFLAQFCKLAGVFFTPKPTQTSYGDFKIYSGDLYGAFETAAEDRGYWLTFQLNMINNTPRVHVGLAPFIDYGCVRTGRVTSVFGISGKANHILFAVTAPVMNMAPPTHELNVGAHHHLIPHDDYKWQADEILPEWITGSASVNGTRLCFPQHSYHFGISDAAPYVVPKTCWVCLNNRWVQILGSNREGGCVTGVEYFDAYWLENGTVSIVCPSNYKWMSNASAPSWAGTEADIQVLRRFNYPCEKLLRYGGYVFSNHTNSAPVAGDGSVNLAPILQQEALSVFLGSSDSSTRTGDISFEIPLGSIVSLDDTNGGDYYVVGTGYQLQSGVLKVQSAIANDKLSNPSN